MLILGLSILIGSHWLLYISAVKLFNITNLVIKRALLGVLLFLAVSFIFSFALVSLQHNIITQTYYIFTNIWLALAINLLWSSLLGWLIFYTIRQTKCDIKMLPIASVLLLLTIGFVIYGYWNGRNPRLKYVTVQINNLPTSWQGKTAAHISDVHAGVINNRQFVDKMVMRLNSVKPDIVFITGDYFDSRDGDFAEYTTLLRNIRADKGIYFVAGNHERYVGEDKTFAAMAEVGVKALRDEEVVIDGLNIIGIDYPGDMQSKQAEKVLDKMNSQLPSILLYHEPKLIAAAKAKGIDLQLAGHTHAGQIWPFQIFTRLIYGRYQAGLYQEGDYTIYTSSGVGTWGPPIRTGNRPEIVVITFEKK